MAAVCVALIAVPASAPAQTPGAPVVPIPGDPLGGSVAPFEGSTAVPNPVNGVPSPPSNPFMAPNGRNNIHDDPYMTDTYTGSGPLGDGSEPSSFFVRECGSITFDSQGRIVTICVGLDRPVLALLDPHTLATLAAMPLPLRNAGGGNPFTDFSGGGYFYLDNHDRAVIPTNDHHVLVVSIAPGPQFVVDRDYDLSSKIPADQGIVSVLPDWHGLLWFVTRGGIVGTIERDDGTVRTMTLAGEGISNSFAVDETGGVYIVSDKALYRFDAGVNDAPKVTWRVVYPNSGIHKPGQSDAGSGTTPTLMGKKWVSITDNADPMDVVVYRRDRSQTEKRLICSEPVFGKGAGSTDNSLIGTDHSMIVENNYGYQISAADLSGGESVGGLARVDVVRDRGQGNGAGGQFSCRTVWTSTERAPSVVPKLSLANGLVYTYTRPPRNDDIDAWYLTTLDFRTGSTIYRRLAGTGVGFNNNYAPVTLGPDGTAYVGVLGGVVEFP